MRMWSMTMTKWIAVCSNQSECECFIGWEINSHTEIPQSSAHSADKKNYTGPSSFSFRNCIRIHIRITYKWNLSFKVPCQSVSLVLAISHRLWITDVTSSMYNNLIHSAKCINLFAVVSCGDHQVSKTDAFCNQVYECEVEGVYIDEVNCGAYTVDLRSAYTKFGVGLWKRAKSKSWSFVNSGFHAWKDREFDNSVFQVSKNLDFFFFKDLWKFLKMENPNHLF